MPRFALAAAALALPAVLAVPQTALARGFSSGVAAGEVRATSAKLWTRAPHHGSVIVQFGRDRSHLKRLRKVKARTSHSDTLTVGVRHLKPGREYAYGFRQGRRRSSVGTFTTPPRASQRKTIRFAWSGDADAQPVSPGGPPYWNHFQVYTQMARQDNAFNVNLGDTIYSDTEVPTNPPVPPATTVAQKWAKYQQNLGQSPLRRLRASTGLYSQWDDHEFLNDFSKAELGTALYRAGLTAFREYAPITYTHRNGLYRSFRWGRNLQVFFLDERSFRSAKASANHVCDNPMTHQPDLAPTAPQSTRAKFAPLVPSFAAPVSQQCLDTINDPNRTLLGHRQYTRFTHAIRHSHATWKVVMNEVPIQQFYALPYDRWEGYAAEREKLLHFLHDHVKNVIFLTTDVHANFVNDARFQTLESGGPQDSGILDVTTGPVATKTFAKEIDAATGIPNGGNLITQAFFKPAPPNGMGMQCAAPDVDSFGEVKVTRRKLTVHLLDQAGHPVIDSTTKQPCAPIVLHKR